MFDIIMSITLFVITIIMIVIAIIVENKYIVKKSDSECNDMPKTTKKGEECYILDKNTCRRGTFDGTNCTSTHTVLPFILLLFSCIFFSGSAFFMDRFITKNDVKVNHFTFL